MKYLLILVLLFGFIACNSPERPEPPANPEDIHSLLDDWHQAASDADFNAYFSYFASDSSIFMGTDATERWTISEFRPWSQPYFDRGSAWDFTPTQRFVYFSEDRRTVWFDEELDTPNLGPSRGSGVLIFTDEGWKIDHYNLSVPIPNEIVGDVVEQIRETSMANQEE